MRDGGELLLAERGQCQDRGVGPGQCSGGASGRPAQETGLVVAQCGLVVSGDGERIGVGPARSDADHEDRRRSPVALGSHRGGGQTHHRVLGAREAQGGQQGHQGVDVQVLQGGARRRLEVLQENLGGLGPVPARRCGQDEHVGLGAGGVIRGDVGSRLGAAALDAGTVGVTLLVLGGILVAVGALLQVPLGGFGICRAGPVAGCGSLGVLGLLDRVDLGLTAEVGILAVIVRRGACVQGFGQLNGAHVVNSNVLALVGG